MILGTLSSCTVIERGKLDPQQSKKQVLNSEIRQMLNLHNQMRKAGTKCGNAAFAATLPLVFNQRLTAAARKHTRYLQTQRYLAHQDKHGDTVGDRVSKTNYRWQHVAENLAHGKSDARSTFQLWLNSKNHCANIMQSKFNEIGIAKQGNYWTVVYATQQD